MPLTVQRIHQFFCSYQQNEFQESSSFFHHLHLTRSYWNGSVDEYNFIYFLFQVFREDIDLLYGLQFHHQKTTRNHLLNFDNNNRVVSL